MDRHMFTLGVLTILTQRYNQLRLALEAHGISAPAAGATPTRRAVGAGPGVAHRWHGTKLQLKKPDGNWGQEVDLRGPRGGVAVVRASSAETPPAPERIQRTDYDDTRFAYVGFASRVVRLDYSVHPPLREVAPSGDWESRHALEYSPG